MRMAFVGKGGGGKTTLTSLFARFLSSQKLPVLAIDADINQHLAQSIGMPFDNTALIPAMGNEMNRIKDYLKGSNRRISSLNSMIKTTPPGTGSRLIKFSENNPIYNYFEHAHDNIRIMAVGAFTEEDLGIKCYHSKTGSVELLLNHMIDKENEYVLVDMTAGSDSFASGLFTKFDITFLVVEPTLKSIQVYRQYKDYAQRYGVNLKVIANKIGNQSDLNFLMDNIPASDLTCYVENSEYIKKSEQGTLPDFDSLEPLNLLALRKMKTEIDSTVKNWKRLYEQMVHFHILNANSWANAQAGEDLTRQIDPNFTFTV